MYKIPVDCQFQNLFGLSYQRLLPRRGLTPANHGHATPVGLPVPTKES
jgi:hypothetical protein